MRSELERVKLDIEKYSNASKAMDTLLKSQVHDKLKRGTGYNATPPPYNNNYIPPISDLRERHEIKETPSKDLQIDPSDEVIVEEEESDEYMSEKQENIPLENHIITNEKGGKTFLASKKVENLSGPSKIVK